MKSISTTTTSIRFPTSEEIYHRLKSDCLFNQSKVEITYFDSVKNRFIDCPFCQWKSIKEGGEIPWHRVYYLKYNSEIIWNREEKKSSIDSLYQQLLQENEEKAEEEEGILQILSPSPSSSSSSSVGFRIMTWNILSDYYQKQITNLQLRQEGILTYLRELFDKNELDFLCLQEVTKEFFELLLQYFPTTTTKKVSFDESSSSTKKTLFHVAKTDLKSNNLVFVSKYSFSAFQILSINTQKQILQIQFQDKLHLYLVHLTSNYAMHAASHNPQRANAASSSSSSGNAGTKRNLQLSQLLQTYQENLEIPTLIIGDFNTGESIDILANHNFLEASVDDFTYNPELNRFAKLLSITQEKQTYDRLFYSNSQSFFQIISTKVDTTNQLSDHFPVKFHLSFNSNRVGITENNMGGMNQGNQKRILSPNKFALSIILPIKFWKQIAALSKQHVVENGLYGKEKWMPHVTLFLPFLEHLSNEESETIQLIVAKRKYFNQLITIKEFSYFQQSESSFTVFGKLSSPSEDILQSLYEEIAEVLNLAVLPREEFHPHFTIPGVFNSLDEVERFINANTINIEFPLKRICYLANINQQFYETMRIFGLKKFDGSILDFLGSTMKVFFNEVDYQIKLGGSAVFNHFLDDEVERNDIHDYDILIVGTLPREEFMKRLWKIFKTSGLFVDVRSIINQHTHYLKVFNEDISYDIHYVTNLLYKNYDTLSSQQYLTGTEFSSNQLNLSSYTSIDLNSISLEKASTYILQIHPSKEREFVMKLKLLKTLSKRFGIYGRQYGYLPGISYAILLSHYVTQEIKTAGEDKRENPLMKPDKEFIANFCEYYSNYDFSIPIMIYSPSNSFHSAGVSAFDKAHMHLINPVKPHTNVVRTMTKSTFEFILHVWRNHYYLEDWNYLKDCNALFSTYHKTEILAYGSTENDLKLFINMFDSLFIRLVLLFEECEILVIPSHEPLINMEEKSFRFYFYQTTHSSLLGVNTVWEFLKSNTLKNFGKQIFLQIR